jgi:acetolactate synthase I/III small subunit
MTLRLVNVTLSSCQAKRSKPLKKHTIVALMQDRPGVLNRAVSLFRRRGFNIESLAVGHSETPGVSRMTLVVESDEVEQVTKQLYRLIDVIKVSDVTDDPTVEREMVVVKLHAPSEKRAEIVALTEVFDAKIVDVGTNSLIIEMTGAPGKVQNFIDVIRPFGVKEMMRTGRIAMVRGTRGHPADAHTESNGHANERMVLN